mgnify:CR=1 FL=1
MKKMMKPTKYLGEEDKTFWVPRMKIPNDKESVAKAINKLMGEKKWSLPAAVQQSLKDTENAFQQIMGSIQEESVDSSLIEKINIASVQELASYYLSKWEDFLKLWFKKKKILLIRNLPRFKIVGK